jgi:hypothetical protein
MDHWALLMLKDPESRRTHCRKPLCPVSLGADTTLVLQQTYMLADYWYCSCAADSPAPGFIVPAAWPPEPVEPSGAWEEGSATQGSDACGFDAQGPDATGSGDGGFGAADAEADSDAGGADAGADAEAGTS